MKKVLWFLCLLLPLAGCLRLERDYPERELFSLEVSPPPGPPSEPLFGAVRVSKFRVASPFAGKGFVYRTAPLQYQEDFYNRFVAPSGELIAGQSVRWLTASGLFAAVYGGPSPVEPQLLLEGEVLALYGDFRERPPRAVLEIVFTATRADGAPQVVLHHGYRREVPLQEGGSAALAAGWSEALAEVLRGLESDLRRAAREKGRSAAQGPP